MMLPVEVLLADAGDSGSPKDSRTYRTYEGRSGTLEKTVDAPAFVEDFPVNYISVETANERTVNGIAVKTDPETNTMMFNGTATATTTFWIMSNKTFAELGVNAGDDMFASGFISTQNANGYFNIEYVNAPYTVISHDTGNGCCFTVPDTELIYTFFIRFEKDSVLNNYIFKPCLTKGSKYRGYISPNGGIVKATDDNGHETEVFLAPDTTKPIAGFKTFDGVTNIISDFDVKLLYAKNTDKFLNQLEKVTETRIGTSGTIYNTVEAPAFVEDFPVNLLEITAESATLSGVTVTVDKDSGTVTLNGTCNAESNIAFAISRQNIDIESDCCFYGCPPDDGYLSALKMYFDDNTEIPPVGTPFGIAEKGKHTQLVYVIIRSGATYNNYTLKPTLVKGSSPRGFIPYGGGIIKTTGKNLFNGKMEIGYINPTTGEKEENEYRYRSVDFIKVNPNTTYTISRTRGSNRRIIGYDNNLNIITDSVATGRDTNGVLAVFGASDLTYTFTTSPTTQYIRWADTWRATNPNAADYTEDHTQIELGSVATEYEEGASIKLTPNMSKPVAGLKTFDGVTNVFSDFETTLTYPRKWK